MKNCNSSKVQSVARRPSRKRHNFLWLILSARRSGEEKREQEHFSTSGNLFVIFIIHTKQTGRKCVRAPCCEWLARERETTVRFSPPPPPSLPGGPSLSPKKEQQQQQWKSQTLKSLVKWFCSKWCVLTSKFQGINVNNGLSNTFFGSLRFITLKRKLTMKTLKWLV